MALPGHSSHSRDQTLVAYALRPIHNVAGWCDRALADDAALATVIGVMPAAAITPVAYANAHRANLHADAGGIRPKINLCVSRHGREQCCGRRGSEKKFLHGSLPISMPVEKRLGGAIVSRKTEAVPSRSNKPQCFVSHAAGTRNRSASHQLRSQTICREGGRVIPTGSVQMK